MTDYTNVEFGPEEGSDLKRLSEFHKECSECGDHMVLDGFDGDNGYEHWICFGCDSKEVDEQIVTRSIDEQKQFLVNEIEKIKVLARDLSPSAAEIAREYAVDLLKLLDQLKSYGKKFWEAPEV